MTLPEIKAKVMDHWMQNYRKTAMAQPQDWLNLQAEATAKMMQAEIQAQYLPGFNSIPEVWTGVARMMLRSPPVKEVA